MRLVPAAVLRDDLLRRLVRMIVQAKQKVAVPQNVVRTQRQGVAEHGLGRVELAEVLERCRQVTHPAMLAGIELQGLFAGQHGRERAAGAQQQRAQVAVAVGIGRMPRIGLHQRGQAFVVALQRHQAAAEVVQASGVAGNQGQEPLEGVHRLLQPAGALQHHAEAAPGFRVVAVQVQGLAELGFGRRQLAAIEQQVAEVVVGGDETGVDLDGVAIGHLGVVVVAGGAQQHAQIGEAARGRLQRHGPLRRGDAWGVLPSPIVGEAENLEGGGVVEIGLDGGQGVAQRRIQVACLEGRGRQLHRRRDGARLLGRGLTLALGHRPKPASDRRSANR